MKLNKWEGRRENVSLDISFSNNNDFKCPKEANIRKPDLKQESLKADKLDYLVAASSGILTSLLDILWVGDFSLQDAQTCGTLQLEKIVISLAQKEGCKATNLKRCIAYLEKNHPLATDKITNDFGGGLQHHLRDFSHHASPFGLICSILNQFTEKGYGTDTDGRIITPKIPDSSAIGDSFVKKIQMGIIEWLYHLISDMAGSSNSSGKGTGIPGPMLSLAKVMSATPLFHDLQIKYEEDEISFYVFVTKLFNGTAFKHTSNKNLIRFDLRTEFGISTFIGKQAIPVIINQCIVRGFYFFRNLSKIYSEMELTSVEDCYKIDFSLITPFNNRCIDRMITISTGVFSAIDCVDSIVMAKIKKSTKADMVSNVFIRLNFVGVATFALSLKKEAKHKIQDIKNFLFQNSKVRTEDILEDIDIDVVIDNTRLYEYAFKCMYRHVKEAKEQFTLVLSANRSMEHPLLTISDENSQLYNVVANMSKHSIMVETENLIMRLLKLYNIEFEQLNENKYIPFIMTENNKRIAYHFSESLTVRIHDWKTIIRKYNIDRIKVIGLVEKQCDTKTLSIIINDNKRRAQGFVDYITLEDFFEIMNDTEYSIYKKYCDKFNESIRKLIAYSTVSIPSDDMLSVFKENEITAIQNFEYSKYTNGLYDAQIDILKHNYFDKKRFLSLFGTTDFANSFISAEWYYSMHSATMGIEQTAIIAGYLKSIEQLLFKIVCLSLDTGKTIKKRNSQKFINFSKENYEQADITLGSLIGFVKHYSDIWNVNSHAKYFIVAKLTEYRQKYRNDHFHKDNVYKQEDIQEIREQTILLFYLLLGAFSISDDQITNFNLYNPAVFKRKSLQYKELETWIDGILGGDNLLDKHVPLYFRVTVKGCEKWELILCTFDSFKNHNDFQEPVNIKYPYVCDALSWDAIKGKEATEQEVIGYMKQYLDKGKYAFILKRHSMITVDWLGKQTTIYKK